MDWKQKETQQTSLILDTVVGRGLSVAIFPPAPARGNCQDVRDGAEHRKAAQARAPQQGALLAAELRSESVPT